MPLLCRSPMPQLLTQFVQSFVILLTVIISLMTQRSKAAITDRNYSSVFKGPSIIFKPGRTLESTRLSGVKDDILQNGLSSNAIHFKVKDTQTHSNHLKTIGYRISGAPTYLVNSHATFNNIFSGSIFKKRHLLEETEAEDSYETSTKGGQSDATTTTTTTINNADSTTEPNYLIHICNVNFGSYQCLCSNCGDHFLNSPNIGGSMTANNLELQCCNTLFPNTTLQQSVDIILKLFTFEDFLNDTHFEDKIRDSIATSVQQYCNPDPVLCPMIGWETSDTSNYTITHILIISLQQNNNDLVVSVLVLMSEDSMTIKNQTLMMNNSHPLASDILQAAIRNQSDYISEILGTEIWIQGMKNETPNSFVAIEKKHLKLIVLGAIGGFIMAAICLLSAVKAVRDRRDIKARIIAKKERAQKKPEIDVCGQLPLERGEAETSIMEENAVKQNHLKNGKTPSHVIEALVHVYNNCNGSDSKITNTEEIKMAAHNNNKGGQNGRSIPKAEIQSNGKEHSGSTVKNGNGAIHSDNGTRHIVANGNHEPGIDNNAFDEV